MSVEHSRRPPPTFEDHRSYADPALLAGRSLGSIAHLVALTSAAAADFGQFYGVVELAMPELTGWTAFTVVCGFTGAAIFLAHTAGAMCRDRRAGLAEIRKALPVLCTAGWLLLGACACFVRLALSSDDGGDINSENAAAQTAEIGTQLHLNSAVVLFLALYVATGLVAGVGGYLNHNPARSAHLRARLARALAARKMARAALARRVAIGNRELQKSYQQQAIDVLRRERDRRGALAEEFKQHARLLMAQRARDPAMTDALFEADRNPYQPPQD